MTPFVYLRALSLVTKKDIGKVRNVSWKTSERNDIYKKLKDARNKTVAHTSSSYQGYKATQEALAETATYLIKRENRLKNLVSKHKISDV